MRSSLLASVFVAAALPALAQSSSVQQAGRAVGAREFQLEISGGAGFTAVNVEKWYGSSSPRNEEQMLGLFDARLLFANAAGFRLGIEGGYRYFFYYEVPSGVGSNMYYYDVEAYRIGGVARRPFNANVALDLGGAAYMFDGYTNMGLSAAIVFSFPIAGKVSIPLHLRTDLVFDDELMIGSGATLGIGVKW